MTIRTIITFSITAPIVLRNLEEARFIAIGFRGHHEKYWKAYGSPTFRRRQRVAFWKTADGNLMHDGECKDGND